MALLSGFNWKSERLGLLTVASSVVIIALVLVLVIQHQQSRSQEQIRSQGLSLVRLLATMPLEELTPESGRQGIFSLLRQSLLSNHFAYLALMRPDGQPLLTEAASGVIVPQRTQHREPSHWIGQQQLSLPEDARQVLEFHAPVLENGELRAFVRLAFFKPNLEQQYPLLPFYASLTLLIFLPVCGLYLLTRRELRPMAALNEQMQQLVNEQQAPRPIKLEASGDLLEFSRNFNQLVDRMQQRLDDQERQHQQLLISERIGAYQLSQAQAMLQTIPEALFVLDEMNRVVYANERLVNYLELDGPVEEGATLERWCPYAEIREFLAHQDASFSSGSKTSHLLFSVSAAHSRKIQFSCYPLFSPRDRDSRFGTLVVGRDVTETQVAIQNRGEFIAQVAHELKTPLNVLSLYSDALLGEEGKETAFRIEACNVIKGEVERASQLISNLLNLSKLEIGSLQLQRQRVRLQDLLKDTFDSLRSSAPDKQLDFHLDIPDEISPLHADKELLRIAVTNLLTNAIKYSNAAGQVSLSAEESDDSISIRVSDEGIGISAEDQRRMFDKFYRSPDSAVRERSGHGLGLSLAKEIVERHHGRIAVDSAPGRGTCFSLHFKKSAALLQQVI